MILPLIKELGELSRAPKIDQTQREKAYDLMSKLRGYGFTIHDCFVMFRGKLSEISIKRNTESVEVKDTTEHDRLLEQLTLFAENGHEIDELEDYRRDKETVDAAGLTFESCAKFSKNLLLLGIDATRLVKLSDDLVEERALACLDIG